MKNMDHWSIEDAEDLYRIPNWSEGYFGVGPDGNVLALTDVGKQESSIALKAVVDELLEQNIKLPVVMRFHDILRNRVRQLNEAFAEAITEAQYQAPYRGVYPIKVNQMREVVDEIVEAGRPFYYGLEAGSKPELMAVLSYDTGAEALTVCNGYKDEDFMRLALLGRKLGRRIIVVIEDFSEINTLLDQADLMEIRPIIGLRIKMRVKTEGRWSESSGDRAKFGLTISAILNAIDLIQERGYGDTIQLLHFHIGSQLSDIRNVKEAVQEAARIYARLVKRGIPLQYLDIGGGLAVDYDGSNSSSHSSMNYSVAEYVRGVVNEVKQICDTEEVAHPTLVSESGRAIAAHHSCLVMQVLGEISNTRIQVSTEPVEGENVLVTKMQGLLENLSDTNSHHDIYNDATMLLNDISNGFRLGIIKLEELARSETIYWRLMNAIAKQLDGEEFIPADLLNMRSTLTAQYLCNFSLFQSAADVWAIEQVMPILPISRLNEAPDQNVTLADITCDSDGRIKQFATVDGISPTLPVHSLRENEDYYVAMFLTGAYQDVMGDTHNLFGRLNEVHIYSDTTDPTGFYIEETVAGSSAGQVLQVMQFNPPTMCAQVKSMIDRAVAAGDIRSREGVRLVDFYESRIGDYTYLS